MSVKDVKNIRSAYERMLEDGTAFKQVDMSMMVEPDVSMAEGGLGDRIEETAQPRQGRDTPPEEYDHNYTDYTEHDEYIQGRINRLRAKMSGRKGINENSGGVSNTAKEIKALKKRIDRLEEALMVVMETHERLLD